MGQVKKSTPETSGGYSPVVKLLLAVLGCYLVFSLISSQLEINSHRKDLEAIQAQCEEQRMANKDLERELALGEDEEYVEWAVRNKLGYGYPDEKLYRDVSGMQ